MAINPNTDFTTGQVLTADQANRWPRGIMARAGSTTSYTLTTSSAIATGMTVTFAAIANRYYKITYYEPQAQTANITANTQTRLKLNSAAGQEIGNSVLIGTGTQLQFGLTIIKTMTFSAGSVTIVGCGETGSTSGTPLFVRDSAREALLIVEDIGPA